MNDHTCHCEPEIRSASCTRHMCSVGGRHVDGNSALVFEEFHTMELMSHGVQG